MNDDLDRLMAVMEAGFDPHWREAWTRQQVGDSLLMSNSYMILANEQGGKLDQDGPAAGFVLGRHAPGEDELLLIAVRPDLRGRGIGRGLLGLFEAEARSRGAEQVFLEMRANNPAERLYRAAGYRQIGLRKAYYRTLAGETLDALTFGKPLAPL